VTSSNLDRREVLPILFPDPSQYLIVSGLAGSSRDAAALTADGDNLYTMAGAMGAAVSMGLGIALSAPNSKVAVITGDGELLMNVGALATVASVQPENLTIVCIDNGLHGETGGQPGHTSGRTNLAMMAEGAGIASITTISRPEQLTEAAQFLLETRGPRFVWARVQPGPPANWKRDLDLAACRLRFRDAYLNQGHQH